MSRNLPGMKDYEVSIILPVYNPGPWVFSAIDSVISQTYEKWVLYIVDDASPNPRTEEIKQRYASEPRIKLIQNRTNLRAAGVRMQIIGQFDSDFTAFIDQDDLWLEDKLEQQLRMAESNPGVSCFHSNIEMIDESGTLLHGQCDRENNQRNVIDWENKGLAFDLFRKNMIRLVSVLVRTSDVRNVGGFNLKYFGGEDWEFWVRLSRDYKFFHIKNILIQRRRHSNNTSSHSIMPRTLGLAHNLEKALSENPALASIALERMKIILKRTKKFSFKERPVTSLLTMTEVVRLLLICFSKRPVKILFGQPPK